MSKTVDFEKGAPTSTFWKWHHVNTWKWWKQKICPCFSNETDRFLGCRDISLVSKSCNEFLQSNYLPFSNCVGIVWVKNIITQGAVAFETTSLFYSPFTYKFYFVFRGLPPSQGGKYVGFGSGPVQSQKNADSGSISSQSQISGPVLMYKFTSCKCFPSTLIHWSFMERFTLSTRKRQNNWKWMVSKKSLTSSFTKVCVYDCSHANAKNSVFKKKLKMADEYEVCDVIVYVMESVMQSVFECMRLG